MEPNPSCQLLMLVFESSFGLQQWFSYLATDPRSVAVPTASSPSALLVFLVLDTQHGCTGTSTVQAPPVLGH